MIRLFVAVPLPAVLRQSLVAISTGVPGARWTQPDNLHLTLRFIGEVAEPDFHDIAEVLSFVDGRPFQVRVRGVGQFGDRKRARVLWAGVEPNDELQRLRTRIDNLLGRVGIEPEGRKFTPHVTLARLKGAPMDRVGRSLCDYGGFEAPSAGVRVEQVVEFRCRADPAHDGIVGSLEVGEQGIDAIHRGGHFGVSLPARVLNGAGRVVERGGQRRRRCHRILGRRQVARRGGEIVDRTGEVRQPRGNRALQLRVTNRLFQPRKVGGRSAVSGRR